MKSTSRWDLRLATGDVVEIEPAIEEFLTGHQVDSRASYVARLVIEEILRNLIEHPPPDADHERATLQIAVEPAELHVVIEDTRPPFDPLEVRLLDVDAPLEQRRSRGMGLRLIRELTDEIRYERVGARNRLTAIIRRT